MPAKTGPGRTWRIDDRLDCFEADSGTRAAAAARHRLRPGPFPQDRQGARLASAWHRTFAPGSRPCAHAGREVTEGFFNPETAPGLGRFDAIHLNNVLEHVPDPAESLLLARDLLEPGGMIRR